MTPVPLHLPLRPSDATELANLIFDHAEGKPLTDELRQRLAARAGGLKLQTVTPWFGSLERDPVHPSAYYLAVDCQSSGQLLYMALSTAPTSSIYYKPLLIGRMRRHNGPEMVINAIPFGPTDRENVETFAGRIHGAFHPQPQGARSTITVEEDYPAAFGFFRTVQKRTGKNLAALAGDYHGAVWAAIRAGWRSGFTVATEVNEDVPEAAYSRYSIRTAATESGLRRAEEIHEQIRRARARLKIARGFDFEIVFEEGMSGEGLREALERLRAGAHAPQLVGGEWGGDMGEICEVARAFQVTISLRYGGAGVARGMAGKFNYRVKDVAEGEMVAEQVL